jgi:hypothetical protein
VFWTVNCDFSHLFWLTVACRTCNNYRRGRRGSVLPFTFSPWGKNVGCYQNILTYEFNRKTKKDSDAWGYCLRCDPWLISSLSLVWRFKTPHFVPCLGFRGTSLSSLLLVWCIRLAFSYLIRVFVCENRLSCKLKRQRFRFWHILRSTTSANHYRMKSNTKRPRLFRVVFLEFMKATTRKELLSVSTINGPAGQ